MRRVLFLVVVFLLFVGCKNPNINTNQYESITLDDETSISIAIENGNIQNINNIADGDLNSCCSITLQNGFASLLISNASSKNLNFNFTSNAEITYNIYSEYRSDGAVISKTKLTSNNSTSLDDTISGASTYNYYYIHLRCSELAYINIYNFSYN